ncbi:hypothetical protein BK411_14375 [Vibrio splendidus]|nr:hypothetical protein BK411_14375 [Vibrio splendidus]
MKRPIKIKRPKAALFFYVFTSLYKQANATSIVLMVIELANDNSAKDYSANGSCFFTNPKSANIA